MGIFGVQACASLEMGFVKHMSLGARRPAATCPAVSVTGSAISSKPLKSSRPQFTHLYKKGVKSVAEQMWRLAMSVCRHLPARAASTAASLSAPITPQTAVRPLVEQVRVKC